MSQSGGIEARSIRRVKAEKKKEDRQTPKRPDRMRRSIDFGPPKKQRITQDGDVGKRHGGGGNERVQQPKCCQRNRQDVV
jgi:hypothetical protein